LPGLVLVVEPSSTLRADLATVARAWRRLKAPPTVWFINEFLVQRGIDGLAQKLPAKYPSMMPQQCFQNVRALTRRRTGLRYCEGHAQREMNGLSFLHAWALDTDNRVIDPTLGEPEKYHYLGVPIPPEEYKIWTSRQSLSVLDTGRGHNIAFMLKHCPDLLDLVEPDHRAWVAEYAVPVAP
jgi:hypothetical protein